MNGGESCQEEEEGAVGEAVKEVAIEAARIAKKQ